MITPFDIFVIFILWISCGVLARILFWLMEDMGDDITQGQLFVSSLFGVFTMLAVIIIWIRELCDSTRVIIKGKSK